MSVVTFISHDGEKHEAPLEEGASLLLTRAPAPQPHERLEPRVGGRRDLQVVRHGAKSRRRRRPGTRTTQTRPSST